jgi:VanZ family protein
MSIRPLLLRVPALLIAGTIFFLSTQSSLPHPKSFIGLDKLLHFTAYGALGFAAFLWVPPAFWKRRPVLSLLLITTIVSAYGITDELHQYFVPGRDCDIWDWVADTLGAFTGALVAMMVLKKILKRQDVYHHRYF